MKNLIELNKEIEAIFNPEIYVFNEYRNITFRKHWVNDIYDNQNYFYDWEENILNKINNTVDLDSPSKIKFIKIFHQDVLKKYNDLSKIDYENLDYLKSFKQFPILFSSTINKSKNECREFYFHPDDFRYGDFLDLMARIFHIEDFNFYDAEYDSSEYKDVLEDSIMNKLHNLDEIEIDEVDEIGNATSKLEKEDVTEFNIDEIDETTLDKIEEILFDNKVEVEVEINRYYSYGFLSYCLENTRNLLKNIAKHLDDTVNFIKKLENYKEDEFTLDEVYDNDPNNLKLEFKINKMEVALFYRALHDTGVIDVNNQGQKHPYTNLKKYINSSNMYYLENMKVDKVKNINKEFSKFLNDNKYEKQEIEVLELIISKFKNRKEEILANQEKGLA